jgi:hypothetical protein
LREIPKKVNLPLLASSLLDGTIIVFFFVGVITKTIHTIHGGSNMKSYYGVEYVANYGIFQKKPKKGMVPYVLQWDFSHNCICFSRRGALKPKNKIAFYKILKVTTSATHPHLFVIETCNTDTYHIISWEVR